MNQGPAWISSVQGPFFIVDKNPLIVLALLNRQWYKPFFKDFFSFYWFFCNANSRHCQGELVSEGLW